MSPSERYLAVTVGPDSNAAIQALYNALTGEQLIKCQQVIFQYKEIINIITK